MRPVNTIDPKPWMTSPATRQVLTALTQRGQIVRFVGGCVRDSLLGRAIKDIDLATPDDPETVTALLEAAGVTAIPTGIEHGTITAVAHNQHFEITTLRRDAETFGRHARVEFTDDWIADAQRRDLTINAIYCDPDGTLYDPTGGRDDLAVGRIRFVGDPEARIREDYLRILRFFRFLAWYGRSEYAVEAIKACALLAPKTAGLAGERIAAELFTTLEAPDPVPVFETMVRHRILEAVTPELCDINRLRSLCAFEGAVGVADPLRRFAALIVGNTGAATTIGDRLNLSGKQRQRLITITQGSELVAVEMNKKAARVALYRLRQEAFADLVLLEFASGSDIDRGAGPARALLAYADSWSIPTLPISGRDLLGQGIPEGPRIGRQLEELETWWVANDFEPDRRAMLDRVTSVSGSD